MSDSDDDIDIEEHDVLDNPSIKNTFPDLSMLKREIDNGYDMSDPTAIPKFTLTQSNLENLKVRFKVRDVQDLLIQDMLKGRIHGPDRPRYGIKPFYKKPDKELGVKNVTGELFHGNKIILGSKPNKPSKPQELEYQDFFEEKVKLKGGYVQLDDLGDYLKRSDRYCGSCLILFPNINAYENHKDSIHVQCFTSENQTESQSKSSLSKSSIKQEIFSPNHEQNDSTPTKQNQNQAIKQEILPPNHEQNELLLEVLAPKIKYKYQCKLCGRCFSQTCHLKRHCATVQCTKKKTDVFKRKFNETDNELQAQMPVKKTTQNVDCDSAKGTECGHYHHNHEQNELLLEVVAPKIKYKYQCKLCGRCFSQTCHLKRHCATVQCTKKKTDVFKRKFNETDNELQAQMPVKKTTQNVDCDSAKGTECGHCNKMFPNEEAVISHLYSICLKTKKKSDICKTKLKKGEMSLGRISTSSIKTNNTNPGLKKAANMSYKMSVLKKKRSKLRHNNKTKKPQRKNAKNIISSKASPKIVASSDEKVEQQFYRCPICSFYFITADFCVNHLMKNHNIKRNAGSIRRVSFIPQCFHCLSVLSTRDSHKIHMYKYHHKEMHETKISREEVERPWNEQVEVDSDSPSLSIRKIKNCEVTSLIRPRPRQKRPKIPDPASLTEVPRHKNVPIKKYMRRTENSKEVLQVQNFTESKNLKGMQLDNPLDHPEHQKLERKRKAEPDTLDPDECSTASFVLKSSLFKCNKCDIHFISAKTAINHTDHMELLVNWKCPTCHRIFKKDDQSSHEEQHLVSNDYTVHDINLKCASALSEVLYKCVKCAVHFNEENILKHFIGCGTKEQDLIPCKQCDIMIDKNIVKFHNSSHKDENLKLKNFIVVEADILRRPHKVFEREPSDTLQGKKLKPTYSSGDPPSTPKKIKVNTLLNKLNMCYCDACKCFFMECHERDVHVKSQCSVMIKYVCKFCGLVLTAKSYQTHKHLHATMENLTLKDFNFFDMRSGEKICPPIPKYPKCGICEVHFASKTASMAHACSEDVYLTCHICNIRLCELAFKLHMPFHKFHDLNLHTTTAKVGETENTDQEVSSSCTLDKEIFNGKSDEAQCTKGILNFPTRNLATPVVNINNLNTNDQDSFDNITKDHQVPEDNIGKELLNSKDTNNKEVLGNTFNTETPTDLESKQQKITKEELNCLLFYCKNCRIIVDSYDKVVEHCQWHYSRPKIEIPKMKCSQCSHCDIILAEGCYDDHQKWHLGRHQNDTIKFIFFDIDYFRSTNDVWMKHLFGSLSKKKTHQIIGDTIYKSECRIKMEVLQDGETDLTVYKCEKCQCFIDESSLYRHAETSCFKLRKHSCSFCGLSFLSSTTKVNHEKLHENRNITLESYRIVVFNREVDDYYNKGLNMHSKFVLYQCRNCNVVINYRRQVENHICTGRESKTCLKCGLVISSVDYESHTLKHNELPGFSFNNMKVILLGTKTNSGSASGQPIKKVFYKGNMKDYTFYSCKGCQTCFQTTRMMSEHICSFGIHRLKCPECDLYFPANKIKTHQKIHDIDPDFIRENMRIISIDHPVLPLKSKTADSVAKPSQKTTDANRDKCVKNHDHTRTAYLEKLTDRTKIPMPQGCLETHETPNAGKQLPGKSNTETQSKAPVGAVESTIIYKCVCGLHFLDKQSIASHMKFCNSKIRTPAQKCCKCGLIFTPNILFKHLLLHHGNQLKYKYIIVELTKQSIDVSNMHT